ncbi:hypothetical protein ACFL3J_02700, partial [Candidatus Omnitrophota bacterium]
MRTDATRRVALIAILKEAGPVEKLQSNQKDPAAGNIFFRLNVRSFKMREVYSAATFADVALARVSASSLFNVINIPRKCINAFIENPTVPTAPISP